MFRRTMIFIFIAAFQAFAAFIFIWGLKLPARYAYLVAAAFVIMNLPIPYIIWLVSGARQPPMWAAALIVRPCFAWQFDWLTFVLFLAPLVVLARAGAWLAHSEAVIIWMRYAVFSITALAAALTVYGLADTITIPRVERIEIRLPHLPASEEGLKIAHLSDPHVTWWNSRKEFQRIADLIADMDPDLLVITGDMVDHNPDYVYVVADCLEKTRPRLGRYAVIGNHDVYTGREAVSRRMEERGFTMIRDRWISLEAEGSSLVLAGLDDSGMNWTGRDPANKKLPAIMEGCPSGRPVILLKHRPAPMKVFRDLPVGLVLAGHTHGGQLKLPFGGPGLADITFENPGGTYSEEGLTQHVSRGTGTVGWPFRLFCPAEVSLITLRAEI